MHFNTPVHLLVLNETKSWYFAKLMWASEYMEKDFGCKKSLDTRHHGKI